MTAHFSARQILTAAGLNALIDAIDALAALGPLSFRGTWNATTNVPALASGVGVKGYMYTVAIAGTTALDGLSQWNVGDKAIFNGATWEKIDGLASEVITVAGLTGAITSSALKTALAIAAADVSGLGSLATLSSITASLISDASANGRSMMTAASYAAMKALLAISAADVTGVLPTSGGTLTGLLTLSGDPTANLHAATKQYVDAALYRMDSKQSCRTKTTANVSISGGDIANGTVHDGVTVATNDRICVGSQTAPAENGIYTVPASGAATRAPDMDNWLEIPGAFVEIEDGSVNAGSSYICTSKQSGTLGTTAITWVQATSPASGVSSFNGRNGSVTLISADVTTALGFTPPTNARTISATGLATGGGDFTANRTIDVPAAGATEMRAGTDTLKALTAGAAYAAMAEVAITGVANVFTPDMTAGTDFSISPAANFTLANPSALVVGKKGRFRIVQDATGSRLITLGSSYKWAGGTPGVLSTAASAEDYLDYDVVTSTKIRVALSKGWA